MRFAQKNVGWLEKQLLRQAHAVNQTHAWILQTEILFRGESARLELGTNGETGLVRFGTEVLRVKDPAGDLRPEIEQHLRKLAIKELPFRTLQLAEAWGVPIRRVTVRNQRSRWGSCSRHGTISLNWRLIQTPLLVRDYIILHELAHVKEMSHSARFWSEVERLCPNYAEAERWIKRHSSLLQ